MSEEKKSSSFMQELDAWVDGNVIFPLMQSEPQGGSWEEIVDSVKRAIREKVLQSYKNGRGTRLGGNAPENLPTARRYPVPLRQR